jgi:prophage regulatory protein
MQPTTPHRPALLRLPAVEAETGLSRATIYRLASEGAFPAPVKLGARASAWRTADIDAWIASRVVTSDAQHHEQEARKAG